MAVHYIYIPMAVWLYDGMDVCTLRAGGRVVPHDSILRIEFVRRVYR